MIIWVCCSGPVTAQYSRVEHTARLPLHLLETKTQRGRAEAQHAQLLKVLPPPSNTADWWGQPSIHKIVGDTQIKMRTKCLAGIRCGQCGSHLTRSLQPNVWQNPSLGGKRNTGETRTWMRETLVSDSQSSYSD